MTWFVLAEWWRAEVNIDSTYGEVVTPLLLDILQPVPGNTYLDMGCGEGRVMRAVSKAGAQAHGVDLNLSLVTGIPGAVVADAVALPMARGSYDGVYSVLTLEHIDDHVSFFEEAARVTKPGGALALVINHPIWTAPGSSPISDEDGEVLWRPGEYFSRGVTNEPAGDLTVTFYHRSMSDLVNTAADAGWSLQRMIEQPHHEYQDQSGIPRLLACRWIARADSDDDSVPQRPL